MVSKNLKKYFIRTMLVLALMTAFSGTASAAVSIMVNSPNGGENWVAGTQHNITWTAVDYSACTVTLSYSTTGLGGSYTNIGTGLNPGTGKYLWTIPNTLSTTSYVKAYLSGCSRTDISNAAFTIRGPDITKPVITVLGSNTLTIEAGSLYTDAGATALDDVDGVITSSIVTVNPVNTAVLGTYTVTYNVKDSSNNNADQKTRTVHVNDTTAPTIDLVTPIVSEATSSSGATVTFTPPMSHDAVDGNLASSCDASTGTFPIGVTTVTCTKTDAHSNVAIPSVFTITVHDTTAPTVDSVSSIVAEATSLSGAAVTITPPASHDAVDGDLASSCDASTGTFPFGVTTVTCSKTDAHSNVATPSVFTITVQDITAPTIDAVTPIVIEAASPSGESVTITPPMSHDVVDGELVSSCDASTGIFPLGITTVTCTKTDTHSNVATASVFTVTVQDTVAPSITAPSAVTAEATGVLTGVTLGTATATDIADPAPVVTNNAPATFPVGTTTVTWNATDASGNYATATQSVTITDTTAPSITPPSAVTTEATGVLTGVTLGTATATDIADPAPVITNNAPATFPVGTTTVTWNATDVSGNYATATQSVTITDTTAPFITAPTAVIAEATGFLTIVTLGTPIVNDIADPAPVVTNNAPLAGFPVGTTIVTWNATDASGNYATATQSVTIANFNAIKNGANRLVQTQNSDGTWEWSNPDTNPATTSYPAINNILGVTAKGLVRAYLVTGNVSYLDAAKKTADLLVSKTPDGFGPDNLTTGTHKVYGQDITFLVEFANAWAKAGNDGSAYSAKADDYMVFMLNNPNRFCATGCANNASALVEKNFNTRQPNLYGWDIEGWVEAAVRTGHTTFASEVVSNMSLHSSSLSSTATGTLGGTGAYYVLGLSGYLQSYILTGKTPAEYLAIKDQLLEELNTTDGSFNIYAGTDDGIMQTTAYALLALTLTTTDMTATVNYLENSQSPGGIWLENDGTEYPEVESEILSALVTFDETPPVITLLGSDPVSIFIGQTYTDAGATALDNYDGVITSSIVTVNQVNSALAGTYTVTYNVTDAHGNAATQVTRIVTVTIPPTTRYINGTVIDSGISHTPLAGVTVSTTGHSALTDGSGKYSLAVASGSYPLTASYDIRYYTNSSVTVSTEFVAVVNQDIVLQLKPVGTISGAVTVG